MENRKNPTFIPDDGGWDLNDFVVPDHYLGSVSKILIPEGLIHDRVEKIAHDIRQNYKNETVHLICILKGGHTFFSDLCQALKRFHQGSKSNFAPFSFDFIRVKSYHGTESTGKVTVSGADLSEIKGRHVILVEDIIDTGLTMTSLLPELEKYEPASVKVASLLEKRTDKSCGYKADYVAFSIPDAFVVGYCLDYNEVFRELNHICIISNDGIEKYKHGYIKSTSF